MCSSAYTARTTCYIEIHKGGRITHGKDWTTYERAVAGESKLSTAWSSHLFVIDDLNEYATAHGIKHDVRRPGLTRHVYQGRWTESGGEQNPAARTSASRSRWNAGARSAGRKCEGLRTCGRTGPCMEESGVPLVGTLLTRLRTVKT